jgi:2Fe-2S ferredoxin
MPNLTITGQSGDKQTVDIDSGTSLMEAIRDNGFDEMLAMCGGSCSCATCHVFIDEEFGSKIPAITEAEDNLLDASEHRTAQSRLSCQIVVTDELDGMHVLIAPED